ncbi:MAG: hypothetical protein GY822_03865 [Deltaproteobacteria bacterium]|nr:hypothetical protein [Deltaproteobacteria bacterium]
MLEPISLGQGRTHCPGLAADERGVVMGRRVLMLFADIARTVGFFRTFSREVTLDEILASLELKEAQGERGGREIMVRFEIQGSYDADRAAKAARMHKGRVFTGTESHFLPYRNRSSPLGFDLGSPDDLVADPKDFTLYTEAGPDRRTDGREIMLKDLILGLTPRPLTQQEKVQEQTDSLVICCEQGLASEVCRYLWQRQIRAAMRSGQSARKSLFSGKERVVQLVACENIPRHMAQLLASTPGITVFIPVEEHLLVEWGFRHPIALESCSKAFEKDESILFYGPPKELERLLVDEDSVDISDLVEVTLRGPQGVIDPPEEKVATPIEALNMELKLARLPGGGGGAVQALLIPLDRLNWFIKLVYMLPAAVLRAYEAVIADPYVIVINRRGIHGIPFGIPMTEMAPQIFVPVGMQLLPRVEYDLLREHLHIRPDQNLYFFPEHEDAFAVATDSLKPLSRAIVADEQARQNLVELRTRNITDDLEDASITHRRQGVFSLWRGTKTERKDVKELEAPPPRKALPEAVMPPVSQNAPSASIQESTSSAPTMPPASQARTSSPATPQERTSSPAAVTPPPSQVLTSSPATPQARTSSPAAATPPASQAQTSSPAPATPLASQARTSSPAAATPAVSQARTSSPATPQARPSSPAAVTPPTSQARTPSPAAVTPPASQARTSSPAPAQTQRPPPRPPAHTPTGEPSGSKGGEGI